jgi:succinate-semialdehyde dehydrogenase/glutarate-semialdehyde dehydrogenase
MALEVLNPATGKIVDTYAEFSTEHIRERIAAADMVKAAWRGTELSERSNCLREAADILENEENGLAALMAMEMGKPVSDGRAEIQKCAWVCRHYADKGSAMLAPEEVETDAAKSYVAFRPIGVVLAVMPWNYPFWQVFRFAAPALMAGNAALLKPAANVPGCGLAVETVVKKAGCPKGLFQTLLINSERVREVIEHDLVGAVTLTGSVAAGREAAAVAGKALKKTVLELGGSDPYLILADADLESTVEACAASRLLNSGQSCIAAKRFIVVPEVRREFEDRLIEKMKTVRSGDPRNESTEIGPLAREDLRDTLQRQVRRSTDEGARCLLGGEIPPGKGFFYPPTVLTDVRPGMPVFEEETFGPVSSIICAADEKEAIRLANATRFGLGAAVFTQDTDRGERIAVEDLEAGNCFVNDFVRSDPRLPFGGIRQSGYGRELSHYGIKEFVNIKTVYVG